MQFSITLTAGVRVRQQTAGRLFAILSTGAAQAVAVTLWDGSTPLEELTAVGRGFKARVADTSTGRGFTHVDIVSPVNTTLQLVISNGAIDFDSFDGATVNVVAAAPLPVVTDRGAPGAPLYVAGITYTDAPAVSLVNGAPVAIGAAAAALVPANAARRGLRVTNTGADPVAIGAPGITWASRCIVLQPGDTWVEDRAANLAWSAVCDVGDATTVTCQEVLS